jgi:CheY-like chemotaxis protein
MRTIMQANESVPEQQIEILVVEDSATQAQLLARLLASDGYRVRIAINGREALAAARETAPTLIVSDIAMPEMNGYELCRTIKQDPALRAIPLILLTSLTSLYDVIEGLDCGADNFIRKPYDSAYLLGRIRFILVNRALRDDEQVAPGMRVSLGGQTHFVSAERQQIFDLLISTDADACGRLLRERASLDLGSLLRQPYARTLLYVDDEVSLLAAVTRSMRHKGCEVLAAASAAEAFEILATVEVGVILCGQRMRGMSGTEFLSRVKHMYPDVTRMVLSGYTDCRSV